MVLTTCFLVSVQVDLLSFVVGSHPLWIKAIVGANLHIPSPIRIYSEKKCEYKFTESKRSIYVGTLSDLQ